MKTEGSNNVCGREAGCVVSLPWSQAQTQANGWHQVNLNATLEDVALPQTKLCPPELPSVVVRKVSYLLLHHLGIS
jgi:hypothetical protein